MKLNMLLVFTVSACSGTSLAPSSQTVRSGLDVPDGGMSCVDSGPNEAIRSALAPHCVQCHGAGSSKPYFANLRSFEDLLIYPSSGTANVTPGDPEGSRLVALLEGRASGVVTKMPLDKSYAELVAQGTATLTVDAIKQWIRALDPNRPTNQGSTADLFRLRRLRADEFVLSLMPQLGLEVSDFVSGSLDQPWYANKGHFFVWPVDWAPGVSSAYGGGAQVVYGRFEALGGAIKMTSRRADPSLGPSAMQVVVQLSQAWCAAAVDKSGNHAVLGDVTLSDRSATSSAKIKKNIGSLYLRLLGDPASTTDVQALYDEVFLPLETQASTRAAWVGVCAALVRHPKMLLY